MVFRHKNSLENKSIVEFKADSPDQTVVFNIAVKLHIAIFLFNAIAKDKQVAGNTLPNDLTRSESGLFLIKKKLNIHKGLFFRCIFIAFGHNFT